MFGTSSKTVFSLDGKIHWRENSNCSSRGCEAGTRRQSPHDFIAQNTTQDGEQIDVRIQQDATEFLAKLMQDVERMKSTDISARN